MIKITGFGTNNITIDLDGWLIRLDLDHNDISYHLVDGDDIDELRFKIESNKIEIIDMINQRWDCNYIDIVDQGVMTNRYGDVVYTSYRLF